MSSRSNRVSMTPDAGMFHSKPVGGQGPESLKQTDRFISTGVSPDA
jgi:hypothetical protein